MAMMNVPNSRTGRSSAPSLVYPFDRNGAVRMVETTLSHTQSILSPRSVHTQPHVVPHGELRHVEACRTM
jgi:hypothetical protein